MKKSIIKKIFIRLSKILGYEIIDQNEFHSPTLEKNLNEDLSIINQKEIEKIDIILPKRTRLDIQINSCQFTKNSAKCSVIKDGGDGPDFCRCRINR